MTRKDSLSRHIPLGEAQTREGLKVLKKFVERKYRFSVASLSSEYLDSVEPASPTKSPIGPTRFSVLAPTQSLVSSDHLSVQQPMLNGRFSNSVAFTSPQGYADDLDVPLTAHVKRQKGERTRSYIRRFCKQIFKRNRTEINNVMLIGFLALFALAGGLMFYHLEVDAEKEATEIALREATLRHEEFALRLCNWSLSHGILSDEPGRISDGLMENCTLELLQVLKEYDSAAGISLEPSGWRWDYWNAVFYAGTIFTTIGYGNLHCKTVEGRIATILYAVVGVPFMLIVLNAVGKTLYNCFQRIWESVHRRIERGTTCLQERFLGVQSGDDERLKDCGALEDNISDSTNMSENEDVFETFPLSLALAIIVVYVALCSLVFCYWEDWDYFTAFYFFFISLMTIGFGDEMPKHPHNACAFFIFFIVGLALFSMCLSIMQMRVENRYMAALNLIDEEQKKLPQIIDQEFDQAPTHTEVVDDSTLPIDSIMETPVKWRSHRSTDDQRSIGVDNEIWPRSPCRMSSVASVPANDDIISPVLGVFIARSKSTRASRKSLCRLNSTKSASRDGLVSPAPGTPGSIRHGNAPGQPLDAVDPTVMIDNCMRTGNSDDTIGAPFPTVVSAQSSFSNRGISCTAPLSVITETTEEECSESDQHPAESENVLHH